jgi:hypothetical protein
MAYDYRYFLKDKGQKGYEQMLVGPSPNVPYGAQEMTLQEAQAYFKANPTISQSVVGPGITMDKIAGWQDWSTAPATGVVDAPDLGMTYTTQQQVSQANALASDPNQMNVGTASAPLYIPKGSPGAAQIAGTSQTDYLKTPEAAAFLAANPTVQPVTPQAPQPQTATNTQQLTPTPQVNAALGTPQGTGDPLAQIKSVFGAQWQPSPAFTPALQAKGIYGAVRVDGSPNVFTLGSGGPKILSAEEYKDLFGTSDQNGIVGIIDSQTAQKLGITPEQINAAPQEGTPSGTGGDITTTNQNAPVVNPVQIFEQAYTQTLTDLGLPDIKNQITQINDQIKEIDDKMAQEIMTANDNPWTGEALRSRKVTLIQDKYNTQKAALVDRMQLMQGVYDRGLDEAKFVAQTTLSQYNADRTFDFQQQEFIVQQAEAQATATLNLQKYAGTQEQQDFENQLAIAKLRLDQAQEARLASSGVTKGTTGASYESRLSQEISNLYADRYGEQGAREKVMNILQKEFPNVDVAKDIYNRIPDGYEAKIKKPVENQPTQSETTMATWQWLATEGAGLSDEEKKQQIMQAGLNPETFGIY